MKTLLISAAVLALVSFSPRAALAQQDATSSPESAGEHLFKQNCAVCHSVERGKKLVGPSLFAVLTGPAKKTPVQVRTIIENGKGAMPPFQNQLADSDVSNLILYLKAQH